MRQFFFLCYRIFQFFHRTLLFHRSMVASVYHFYMLLTISLDLRIFLYFWMSCFCYSCRSGAWSFFRSWKIWLWMISIRSLTKSVKKIITTVERCMYLFIPDRRINIICPHNFRRWPQASETNHCSRICFYYYYYCFETKRAKNVTFTNTALVFIHSVT